MTIPERYYVKEIDKKLAQDIQIQKHYLKRKAPCMVAVGLFDKTQNNRIVGVLLFGVSASSTLLKGICGPDEAKNVYEITRIWVEDDTPKNVESFLISQSLQFANREIIVSFAQPDANHLGIIYQASNFYYTGQSSKFKDPYHKGEHKGKHHTSWAHGMTNQEIRDKWGDEVEFKERPRKHRYIYFNLSHLKPRDAQKRKKELLKKLKYKILPYPKKG